MTTKVVRQDGACNVLHTVRWQTWSTAWRRGGQVLMKQAAYSFGGFARDLAFSLNDGDS